MMRLTRLIALALMVLLIANSISTNAMVKEDSPDNYPINTVFTTADSNLIIDGNLELEDLGLPGNGTSEFPFILANQRYSSLDDNIIVQNTDLHLLIENCSIQGYDGQNIGIGFDNVSNIVVSNVSFSGKDTGIVCNNAMNIRIDNCSFENCYSSGFYFSDSINLTVFHSTFRSIGEWAMVTPTGGAPYRTITGLVGRVRNSENITVENNECVKLERAHTCFSFVNCHNLVFNNNSVDTVAVALYMYDCTGVTLCYNDFEATSFRIYDDPESVFTRVTSNFVDGKNLGIFLREENLVIYGESLVSATLIKCKNITIIGGTFMEVDIQMGLWSCINCSFQNVEVFGAEYFMIDVGSFVMENSMGCSISSSTVNRSLGIHSCLDSTIINCIFNYASTTVCAIYLDNSTQTRCINNRILNCDGGIYVFNSYYTAITGNWIELAVSNGISVSNSRHGSISNNSVLGSGDNGIVLEGGSSRFNITRNVFGWNHYSNAVDHGSSNFWDDGISRGNNYSDYSGSGIYHIDGDAASIDHYPSGISPGYWDPSLVEDPLDSIVGVLILIGVVAVGATISVYIWNGLAQKREMNL